ncbi:MAG: glycosyltransferase [Rhodospirillaceae bacterium]|nr:glycosyltransferase [Rhodospirillaceae bacterium]
MEPYFPVLAESFRPDVVWGTFGNTDTWGLCQRMARLAGCPWVGDFKDNWRAFVPNGLQTVMAGRLADATRMTVFSLAHCDQADALFPQTMKTILYSGVDDVTDVQAEHAGAEVQLLLTGSIYDAVDLSQLMTAIDGWARNHPERGLVLRYAGNDGDAVKSIAASLDLSVRIEGFLPQDALHRLQSQSMVNVYIHNPRCLMHHKALELLAQGRPVIAFPDETTEVKELAAETGGCLFACTDTAQVMEALDMMVDNPPPAPSVARRRELTWGERSAVLVAVLADAISQNDGNQNSGNQSGANQ